MSVTDRSRRGITLAEIMVSLALVSVMVVMVVSFVLFITKRTRINTANDAMNQNLQVLESAIESWMTAVTIDKAQLSCSEDGDFVTAEIDDKTYTLNLAYGTLIGELPNDRSINIRTQNVMALTFEILEGDNEPTEYLMYCCVTAQNTESGKVLKYTFCVNPRVGETGGDPNETAKAAP